MLDLARIPIPSARAEIADQAELTRSLLPADQDKFPAARDSVPYLGLPYIGDMTSYTARQQDTLLSIARKFGLGYVEIRAANPEVDPWMPGAGTQITLPTRHLLPDAPYEGLVINLSEMRLYYFIEETANETVADPPDDTRSGSLLTLPIGIGRTGLRTPVGQTRIIRKKESPIWYPTERMRQEKPELPPAVGAGPNNPLGTHALYLGWPTFLIHGTSEPWGIGRRVSSGCIRLYPEDITRLFSLVPVKTPVTIIDQPLKAAWIDGRFYLEAHVAQLYANEVEESGRQAPLDISPEELGYILRTAAKGDALLDWTAVRRVLKERRGYPIAVSRKPSPPL